ncbi:chromate efflux transporter [Pontibacillus yanchengensis]|uniref:Chromate efflux transporter n=2 Tax=Pontibacillus yanchengensis TaxID=462910 RepID=A0ACC7VDM2_9BACI|nr:chromate efflux transporter [Pontibacillus yanchengensis]MYL32420.1 chromate efflux transporter [Pontibacillus yanchengensis]MYL53001.1 chromate efflux transporter [Pontibacillus yanchengensis]
MNLFRTYIEILFVSFRLGLTSFGGPVAHLAYFQDEYVNRRKWLDDKSYADLIALCQFLPGPASSQVGISIGMVRGGIIGGILAWFGFTVPSVIALVLFALFLNGSGVQDAVWISALKVVAVAVVAHAIMNMGKKLTPDRPRITIAVLAAFILLFYQTAFAQISIILIAAMIGVYLFRKQDLPEGQDVELNYKKKTGVVSLILFIAFLIGTPILASNVSSVYITLFDIFYRVGSIVFGGGHVVLPLLQAEVVPNGLVSKELFLAGYGATQAVPGPMFTFSSYLGTIIASVPGAIVATLAMFLPSFFLLVGVLPFWNQLRKNKNVRAGLLGVNAAVVGILLAALYDPIWTSAIHSNKDIAIAIGSFTLLYHWKKPAWLVVLVTVVAYIGVSLLV